MNPNLLKKLDGYDYSDYNLKKLPQDYKEDEFMEKMFLNNIDQEYNTWKTENELGSQIIKLFKIYYNEAQ